MNVSSEITFLHIKSPILLMAFRKVEDCDFEHNNLVVFQIIKTMSSITIIPNYPNIQDTRNH